MVEIDRTRILYAMKESGGDAPDIESENPAECMASILLGTLESEISIDRTDFIKKTQVTRELCILCGKKKENHTQCSTNDEVLWCYDHTDKKGKWAYQYTEKQSKDALVAKGEQQ